MFKGINDEEDEVNIYTLSDWGVGKAKNTPAVFARSMLRARGFTANTVESYTNVWVRHIADNDKLRSSTKSNILRALRKPEISWNTLNRLRSIFRLRKVTYYAKVLWEDGVETFHEHTVEGDMHFIMTTDIQKEFDPDEGNLDLMIYEETVEDKIDTLFDLVRELKAAGYDVDVTLRKKTIATN